MTDQSPEPVVVVPRSLVMMLLGVEAHDGTWFSEARISPTGRRSPFWWREELRQCLAAPAFPDPLLEEAVGLLRESADLTGLCTTPDRFSEAGTGEVFLRMTAHNAKARAFLAKLGRA